MKSLWLITMLFLAFAGCKKTEKTPVSDSVLHDGDIIFQESKSAQSQAIQLATGSKYSHCGIIYEAGGDYFVYEAIQPVMTTPLEEWTNRGKDGHYVVKRLKDADKILSEKVLKKMKNTGKRFNGKDYDLYFGWSDKQIYCSELVWKVYHRGAGIELSKPQQLKDFNLKNPAVKQKLAERYGKNIPLEETVVSPAALFDSPLLYTVISE